MAQGAASTMLQPVLIDPRTRAAESFPQTLSEIDGISRDGQLVLGTSNNGDVVAAARDGTIHVLARGGISPSRNAR